MMNVKPEEKLTKLQGRISLTITNGVTFFLLEEGNRSAGFSFDELLHPGLNEYMKKCYDCRCFIPNEGNARCNTCWKKFHKE